MDQVSSNELKILSNLNESLPKNKPIQEDEFIQTKHRFRTFWNKILKPILKKDPRANHFIQIFDHIEFSWSFFTSLYVILIELNEPLEPLIQFHETILSVVQNTKEFGRELLEFICIFKAFCSAPLGQKKDKPKNFQTYLVKYRQAVNQINQNKVSSLADSYHKLQAKPHKKYKKESDVEKINMLEKYVIDEIDTMKANLCEKVNKLELTNALMVSEIVRLKSNPVLALFQYSLQVPSVYSH